MNMTFFVYRVAEDLKVAKAINCTLPVGSFLNDKWIRGCLVYNGHPIRFRHILHNQFPIYQHSLSQYDWTNAIHSPEWKWSTIQMQNYTFLQFENVILSEVPFFLTTTVQSQSIRVSQCKIHLITPAFERWMEESRASAELPDKWDKYLTPNSTPLRFQVPTGCFLPIRIVQGLYEFLAVIKIHSCEGEIGDCELYIIGQYPNLKIEPGTELQRYLGLARETVATVISTG